MNVLGALVDHYGHLRSRGQAPPYGYSRERIAFALVLSGSGHAVSVSSLCTGSAPSAVPPLCEVPHRVRRTSSPRANFLWDSTTYVFGVRRNPTTRKPRPATREHQAFAALHERLLAHSRDEGLQALLRFVRTWEPQRYEDLPDPDAMLDRKLVFRLEGDDCWLHERPASRAVWAEHLSRDPGPTGLCIIDGVRGSLARVHPTVRGVEGTHSAGAVLVSSNNDTFASYGRPPGEPAPISTEAAFAYTSALDCLLASGSRQRVQLGETTVVFWADVAGDAQTAARCEAVLVAALTEAERTVEETLGAIVRGTPLGHTSPLRPPGVRLHLLGLVPNVGRLSLRLWHVDTVDRLLDRLEEHWSDLRLEPPAWSTPPSVRRLLLEAAPRRASALIPPLLGTALLRSILYGGRYPRRFLAAVIARIRADKAVSAEKAAICRACLARDHRLGFAEEHPPMSLDRDESNPAYRLGRLFAVYERVQRAALGAVNATIRDRFYGAASATPASVFPLLARKCTHHLATLRRNDRRRGLAHWYEQEIDAIVEGLGPRFPAMLHLDDQGRFALGYHHQRTWKREPEPGSHADAARETEAER